MPIGPTAQLFVSNVKKYLSSMIETKDNYLLTKVTSYGIYGLQL